MKQQLINVIANTNMNYYRRSTAIHSSKVFEEYFIIPKLDTPALETDKMDGIII